MTRDEASPSRRAGSADRAPGPKRMSARGLQRVLFNNPVSFVFDAKFSSE